MLPGCRTKAQKPHMGLGVVDSPSQGEFSEDILWSVKGDAPLGDAWP